MAKSKHRQRPRLTEKDSPVTVRSIMGKSFRNLSIESKIKEYKIIKNWAVAVGPIIDSRTEPSRLIGGKLYVKVASHTWVTELMYQKEEIMARLNRELGEKKVTDIIFKQGEIQEAGPEEVKIILPERQLTEAEKRQIEKETLLIKDTVLKEKIARAMEKSFKVND